MSDDDRAGAASGAYDVPRLAAQPPPEPEVHVFRDGVVCDTDTRGHATPGGRSPAAIVVDATEGFVPLWAEGTTLRWRFQDHTFNAFEDPEAAKAYVRDLFANAVLAWGDAAPVRFSERDDAWDFEIAVRPNDDCTADGCVLASAFFPDGGQHKLLLYPKLFEQPREEQLETMVHEIGHVFGLRHFFADVSEQAWPSEVFGTHRPFSIMNYGSQSQLTPEDRADLRALYQLAWSGQLRDVNGTPIRFMRPFHTSGSPDALVAVAPLPVMAPLPTVARRPLA